MNFTVQVGEKRSQLSSVRTYFFSVTPTGVESALYHCSNLKQIRFSKRETTEQRLMTVEYEALSSSTIKMVTIKSVLGRPRQNYTVFIVLDDKKPKIKISGLDQFGGFEGFGEVSSSLSEEILKDELKLTCLAAPQTSRSINRKLIL